MKIIIIQLIFVLLSSCSIADKLNVPKIMTVTMPDGRKARIVKSLPHAAALKKTTSVRSLKLILGNPQSESSVDLPASGLHKLPNIEEYHNSWLLIIINGNESTVLDCLIVSDEEGLIDWTSSKIKMRRCKTMGQYNP